jgi:hypothetical protein
MSGWIALRLMPTTTADLALLGRFPMNQYMQRWLMTAIGAVRDAVKLKHAFAVKSFKSRRRQLFAIDLVWDQCAAIQIFSICNFGFH